MKKGDTLIEVMLAVGIFSMVAVAVVAVMSNGTAGAQTSLETTLTREEIDAQAEALRFIQSSYISDRDDNGRYALLWREIIDNHAITLPKNGSNETTNIFDPIVSCPDLYSGVLEQQHAFVVNTKYLGIYANLGSEDFQDQVKTAVVSYSQDIFKEAQTYPHLIYTKSSKTEDQSALAENTSNYTTLKQVEGIYIVAVKDSGTNIATGKDKNTAVAPAFYDFYIRTCWYGTGDNTPSTISTVIRLYDPDALGD